MTTNRHHLPPPVHVPCRFVAGHSSWKINLITRTDLSCSAVRAFAMCSKGFWPSDVASANHTCRTDFISACLSQHAPRRADVKRARPECLRRFIIPASPFCVALNRRRGRFQEGVETLPDDCIALARCLLDAFTIENLDRPPAIADKAGRLHQLRRKRHCLAIGPQDVRQEFVGVCQEFAFRAIMHHEKPTAHSLFGRMHGIASDRLLDLRQQRFRKADEEIADVFAGPEFGLQQFDWAAGHVALQLHNASIEGNPAVHCGEEAESSLAPYVCGLDRRAVFQNGQQRKDSALRKISVFEKAASFADDGSELELNGLEMGFDSLSARCLQGAEQLIAPQIS